MDLSDTANYQIGIICALPKEMKAVRAILDEEHQPLKVKDAQDNNSYVLGRVYQHNLVIACLPSGEYGTVSAGIVSKDLLRTFPNIRFGLLVGIAGGIPDLPKGRDVRLGDVAVGLPEGAFGGVVQFDLGKSITGGAFERVGNLNKPPTALLTALSSLRSQLTDISDRVAIHMSNAIASYPSLMAEGYIFQGADQDQLMCSRCDTSRWWWILWLMLIWMCPLLRCQTCENGVVGRKARSNDNPKVHYGTIVSGNRVVKDVVLRNGLGREFNAICVEMEAAGIMNNYPCLVIRGICDYADHHKQKVWQEYASLTAAAFAKEVLLHISAAQIHQANPIRHQLENIQQHMQEVQGHLEADRQRHVTQEIRYQEQRHLDCHRAFKTTQYDEAKEAVAERVLGTCQWVLEHPRFKKWHENTTDDLLWVSADPGCGKSVLARGLIENELRSSASHNLCYFFFKDIDERNTLSAALCALLHQVFELQPQLLDLAMPTWERHKNGLVNETESLWSLMERLWDDPRTQNTIFVLDALDECREDHRKRLTNYLVRFYQCALSDPNRNSHWIKFIVTSRPYNDIRLEFQLPHNFPSIRLKGEDETDRIKQEINLVIEKRVEELSSKLDLKLQTRNRLKHHLLQMEHRTYLWLYLAIEGIYEDFSDSYCPEEEVIDNLPTTVEEAYEAILERVREKKKKDVKHILQIVIGAKRALTVQEMAKALGIAGSLDTDLAIRNVNVDHLQQQIKEWCGLFIIINHYKIYLIHQTAKEFLLATDTDDSVSYAGWKHSFRPIEIEQLMTWICTKYILELCPDTEFEQHENKTFTQRPYHESKLQWRCGSPSGEMGDNMAVDNVYHDERSNHSVSANSVYESDSFFEYSAQQWTRHARMSNDLTSDKQLEIILSILDTSRECYQRWMYYFKAYHRGWFGKGGEQLLHRASFAAGSGLLKLLEKLIQMGDIIPSMISDPEALEYASRMGNKEVIQLFITHGMDIRTCQGRSLHWAAERGYNRIVRLLVEHGADVNTGSQAAMTLAAIKNHNNTVELLIRHGADVNANKGEALSRMIAQGHIYTVKLFFEHGASKNLGHKNGLVQVVRNGHMDMVELLTQHGVYAEGDAGWDFALSRAASDGNIEMVRVLLQNGINNTIPRDLLESDAEGKHLARIMSFFTTEWTVENEITSAGALTSAVLGGHRDIMQLLLENGVNISACIDNALTGAVFRGDGEIIKILIEHGADVNAYDGRALSGAIRRGDTDTVNVLLDHGADINTQSGDVLDDTIFMGSFDMVSLLIERGINVNSHDGHALSSALFGGDIDLVRLLVEHGADVNANNGFALCKAVSENYLDIVKLLLDYGGNVYPISLLVLEEAARERDKEMMQLLLDHGADINANDGYLLAKAAKGNVVMVKFLLDLGADVNANRGRALFEAAVYPSKEVVSILLDRGADAHAHGGRILRFFDTELDLPSPDVGSIRWVEEQTRAEIALMLRQRGATSQHHTISIDSEVDDYDIDDSLSDQSTQYRRQSTGVESILTDNTRSFDYEDYALDKLFTE